MIDHQDIRREMLIMEAESDQPDGSNLSTGAFMAELLGVEQAGLELLMMQEMKRSLSLALTHYGPLHPEGSTVQLAVQVAFMQGIIFAVAIERLRARDD